MTILEYPQGMLRGLEGRNVDEAVAELRAADEARAKANPTWCVRPWWWLMEDVEPNRTAPWGQVWYVVDEKRLLKFHSAQYDSSG